MNSLLQIVNDIGIAGFIDILIMSVVIYSLLVWFKRTKAIFVITGMFVLGAGYLIARELGLTLTVTMLQGFFAIFLIAVLVIFQEEIRQFFEFLAGITTRPHIKGRRFTEIPRAEIGILVTTLSDFASERIGALIVLRGKDPMVRHLNGGVDLNGELSEHLLKSLFDPHSLGHDGAVVIHANLVTQFCTHLPLSRNLGKVGKGGTRHAAALGITEVCDALCLVVSEERGTISVARHGEIKPVNDLQELTSILESFYREIVPAQHRTPWKEFFKRNYREKLVAVSVTILLYFVFVHESRLDFESYSVPVGWAPPPDGLTVERVTPPAVSLTLSGPRREFFFVDEGDFSITLDLHAAQAGVITRPITPGDITLPDGLTLQESTPSQVVLQISQRDTLTQ
jgi:uncharacterized protein (TIGR00159 family)